MKKIVKIVFSAIILSAAILAVQCPGAGHCAQAADFAAASDFIMGDSYTVNDTNQTITLNDGNYTLSGTNKDYAVYTAENSNVHITLDNYSCIRPVEFWKYCIVLGSGSTLTISLNGNNTLKSGRESSAIRVPKGTTLIIDGDGVLNAACQNNGSAAYPAVIGEQYQVAYGNITINGGTINCYSDSTSAAAIGTASWQNAEGMDNGIITLNGGIINANIIGGINAAENEVAGNGGAILSNSDINANIDNFDGIIFHENTGTVYGDASPKKLDLPAGKVLVIPEKASLVIPEDAATRIDGRVVVNGNFQNNGSISGDGKILVSGSGVASGNTSDVPVLQCLHENRRYAPIDDDTGSHKVTCSDCFQELVTEEQHVFNPSYHDGKTCTLCGYSYGYYDFKIGQYVYCIYNDSSKNLTVYGNGEMYSDYSDSNFVDARNQLCSILPDTESIVVEKGVSIFNWSLFTELSGSKTIVLPPSITMQGDFTMMGGVVTVVGDENTEIRNGDIGLIKYRKTGGGYEIVSAKAGCYFNAVPIPTVLYGEKVILNSEVRDQILAVHQHHYADGYCTWCEEAVGGAAGDNVSWREDNNTIIISGTGNMRNYSYRDYIPWSFFKKTADKMTAEKGVTSIGNYSFYDFSSLSDISLPDSITRIGEYAFYNCTSLKNVTLPPSVSIINPFAFGGCDNLTDMVMPSSAYTDTYTFSGTNANIIKYDTGGGDAIINSVEKRNPTLTVPAEIYDRPVTKVNASLDSFACVILPEETQTGVVDPDTTKITYTTDGDGNVTISGVKPAIDAEGTPAEMELPQSIGGKTPVISDEVKEEMKHIPHTHIYGDGWLFDASGHYKECSVCNEKTEIEAHSGGTATCILRAECEKCHKEYGECDTQNHVNTVITGVVGATCAGRGYTGNLVCTGCNVVIKQGTEIEQLPHNYRSEVTTEPAVGSDGVRTYICSSCGDTYTEMIPGLPKPAHAHSYTMTVTKEATCVTSGVRTYTCDCGDMYKETIAAIGHDYHSEVTTEPTADSEGVRTYTCSRCGDTYTEGIPKLPKPAHEHTYTMTVTKEATCVTSGVRTYTCDCGDIYTETIAAIGHDYHSEVTKEPAASEEGVRTYTCSRCGDTYTEGIPYETNVVSPKEIHVKVKGYVLSRITLVKGKTIKLVTDRDVLFRSGKKSVAAVNSKGVVKAKKAGTVKITVSTKDLTKKKTIRIRVVKKRIANKKLVLKKTRVTLKKKNQTAQIQVKTLTKKTTDKISYEVTAGKKYVKVDPYGKVTVIRAIKGKKTAVVTIRCGKAKKKCVFGAID